ncbi:MAG TPA: hypothetical protein VFC46_01155 [Humisphaera sp.]|nr:hypothetical protein [Humisphaera sp.]
MSMSAPSLRADNTTQPAPNPRVLRMLNRQAIQAEIAAQKEGIHKLSDGSICIKSGHGMALVHADGRGCGTGYNDAPKIALVDSDLMAGIFFGIFTKPQEAAKLGIAPDQAAKIDKAFTYMDHEGTHPTPVLKLYGKYAKAPEGQARIDAEKALMEKVRAVGQAYLDAEAKKIKDVRALLTPAQIDQLRTIGAKMVRPFEKVAPVA